MLNAAPIDLTGKFCLVTGAPVEMGAIASDDGARVVEFLVASQSNYMTAQTIKVIGRRALR